MGIVLDKASGITGYRQRGHTAVWAGQRHRLDAYSRLHGDIDVHLPRRVESTITHLKDKVSLEIYDSK